MSWGGAGALRFDFDGALRIARRLWTTADAVEAMMTSRVTAAGEALVDWTGTFGTEFVTRIEDESVGAGEVVTSLREGANAWAFQWKSAMDEQNRRLHAAEEQRVKNDRNWMERNINPLFGGNDDLPPAPAEVGLPTAPGFAPTGSLVSY
ncbi:hypothetical protein [Ilumatobacter nonamiensis]|uniref:hypothetical protein n=1 Tax=Ilumatobacter nonamiensis TaxID=467093 RepID=UPI00034B2E83|nr:hypothetical protein [Ilumatobacter nonamiensis]